MLIRRSELQDDFAAATHRMILQLQRNGCVCVKCTRMHMCACVLHTCNCMQVQT